MKANYVLDKFKLENKTPDIGGPAEKTNYNVKITEIEGKIPSISGLATNAALTTVESKYLMLVIWLKKQIMTQNYKSRL